MFSFLLCGKNSFILFNSHLPEKLKTFIEGKVDNMHEVFNSAVDALSQVGSTSHSAEFVDLVSTVDELVRKCIHNFDAHIVLPEMSDIIKGSVCLSACQNFLLCNKF